MKKLILILMMVFTSTVFAQTLEFFLGAKKVYETNISALQKNKKLKTKDYEIFNPFRQYKKKYFGVDFLHLMDSVYGAKWKKSSTIKFVALDGFIQMVEVSKMLEKIKDHQGILAIGEEGKTVFTPFDKKGKMVDPAPFYLVWSGLDEKTVGDYNDALKWPYQLRSIIITE